MKQIQGGVTAAKGFEAAGVEAAIKYQNRKDMALIVSKAPCTVAGTFTSNVVKAAPVLWDKQIVEFVTQEDEEKLKIHYAILQDRERAER